MRSDVRLDSAVFQLTPTRTRCDLVITANGKTEKIASGLLNPFLAHLKAAQDQIAKGGYSVTLEPDAQTEASWFTKDTVERFVRFVSTPEVLERVSTIESEILQIEEAISVQGNESLGLSIVEDHYQARSTDSIEGSKPTFDPDAEKAIVLYKPGSHSNPSDTNGSTTQEENSKVQLLRVLESRKIVLQKEQGMAFARAAAAGFDMDHMAHLISFAECFGASRLMEACLRYMELWKEKHETGQWVEVEAAEAMSARSEFGSLNATGIIISGDARKQKEFGEAWTASDFSAEGNVKAGTHVNDKRLPTDPQVPLGPHEYFQGQFQNPTFPQWPMHSPPGQPMFQPYPVQGMPYYQSYPGNVPYFHPPYPPMEDPRFNNSQRMGKKRHSMDSKDSNAESESSEMGVSSTRSQDGAEQNVLGLEKEASQGHRTHKRHGRSGKKKSGVVVIRNINYITSKRHEASGSESQSASDTETEEEIEDLNSVTREGKHKKSLRSLKKKEGNRTSIEPSNAYGSDEVVNRQEADSGNWQAFQSFLLRAEEKTSPVADDIFAVEKEPPVKRRLDRTEDEPVLLPERDSDVVQEARMAEFNSVSGKSTRIKSLAANDELLISDEGRGFRNSQLDSQFKHIEGGGGGYRRNTSDDFVPYGQEKLMGSRSSFDPLTERDYEQVSNQDNCISQNVPDDSFMIPLRSGAQDQLGAYRRTSIDMDSEFPSAMQRDEKSSSKANTQLSYEPDDLTLMPERGMENLSIGYDPAMDYDIQVPVEDVVKQERYEEDLPEITKEGSQKSDGAKKIKVPQSGLERRKKDAAVRRGTFSKSNPLAEAQKRADNLRAYKADLQKAKKEQEEEEIRRLEALKRERQKRIAARSNPASAQSPLSPKKNRASLPTKLSPSTYRGSKFSDSEPGSSSPLPKVPVRTSSVSSNGTQKVSKTSSDSNNGLSRSISSLPDLKEASNSPMPEAKAASTRTKRLSDPKISSIHRGSSLKQVSSDQVPKRTVSEEPQMKKISAIMQLDKTKSAALPELRIKTSKTPAAAVHKSGSKEVLQKDIKSKTSLKSENINARKSNEKAPGFSNIDNDPVTDPVIEKTVVMLGNEAVPAPVAQASQGIIDLNDRYQRENIMEKSGKDSEYQAIRAPPSPIVIGEEGHSNEFKDDQVHSSEVLIAQSKVESPKSSNSITDKPYQAPYARATSLEDPAQDRPEYPEAPPVLNSAMATVRTESDFMPHVPNTMDTSSVEKVLEMYEKPRNKESKGFRKLLKFGRKSHTPALGEVNQDSDGSTIDDGAMSVSSTDVPILKNLISQDDSHVDGTPPKVSRPFSLLSPFRSKGSEKKLAVA